MKISGEWLENPHTQVVLRLIERGGFQALAVGGCVRNALLNVPVADVDIASSAPPQTVVDLAEAAGLKVVPTGLAHGTVTVVSGGQGFEVTTFRRDTQTDGRHAEVAFDASLEQDAARRDFTMNALYVQADGQVIDPLGGLDDLLARRLRFVGDAEARITEDYLRILRLFRFYAQYGDPDQGIDADALAACAAQAEGLDQLSRERITAEMSKLLAARDPAPAVAAMAQSGVLARILPGAQPGALPILVHFEGDAPGGWLRRLAVLGGADVTERLRMSKRDARDLDDLRTAIAGLESAATLGYRLGARKAADAVLARAALFETPPDPDWPAHIQRGANAKFPLKPADLMPALQGPALGEALKRAEAHWIAQGFDPDRAALKAYLGVA